MLTNPALTKAARALGLAVNRVRVDYKYNYRHAPAVVVKSRRGRVVPKFIAQYKRPALKLKPLARKLLEEMNERKRVARRAYYHRRKALTKKPQPKKKSLSIPKTTSKSVSGYSTSVNSSSKNQVLKKKVHLQPNRSRTNSREYVIKNGKRIYLNSAQSTSNKSISKSLSNSKPSSKSTSKSSSGSASKSSSKSSSKSTSKRSTSASRSSSKLNKSLSQSLNSNSTSRKASSNNNRPSSNFKGRGSVSTRYSNLSMQPNTRNMEEICTPGKYKLQKQQEFLQKYVTRQKWSKLLVYHQIGSGKTCTAIVSAYAYRKKHPDHKIRFIVPASLETNLVDAFTEPCAEQNGTNPYATKQELSIIYDSNATPDQKAAAYSRVRARVNKDFEITTISKFMLQADKNRRNLKAWVHRMSKNTLNIVDEVHNLLGNIESESKFIKLLDQGGYDGKMPSRNSVVFRYFASNLHSTGHLMIMSATPIFDNLSQYRHLILAMLDYQSDPEKYLEVMNEPFRENQIKKLTEHIRGKVSFFPGTAKQAYPKHKDVEVRVPISATQEKNILAIKERAPRTKVNDDEEGNAFLIKERQELVVAGSGVNKSPRNARTLDESPKIKALVKNLNLPGKHVVYCTFKDKTTGLDFVQQVLRAEGYISLQEALKDQNLYKRKSGKVFAMWDGQTKNPEKTLIKNIMNNQNNLMGQYLKVILGSRSLNQGISITGAQALHMLDQVWNSSEYSQIRGRVLRHCAFKQVPKNHPVLNQYITFFNYLGTGRGEVKKTADERIFDEILPEKRALVLKGERALRTVAVDHLLFNVNGRNSYRARKNSNNNSSLNL